MLRAEQRELKVDQSDKIDAVLVLDASGSMLVTDPGRLREEGAKLFIQFLKPGDRLAIVSFSDAAQELRPLSEYNSDQGEQINKNIAEVGNSGQFTDLSAGIRLAKDILEKSKREGASPTIILLSDGKMDPKPEAGSAQTLTSDLLNKILPDLKAEGIKIHTLAFSEQADKDLLAQIAVATEGTHYFTPDADKIHESYADLFVAVKKPQMLPLTSKGFKIDANIDEATFYVNAEEGAQVQVVSPTGKRFDATTKADNLKWFKGQKFDVITVQKPEVGDWKILGLPSTDGFATVLTNLKLVTDWPASMNLGAPVLLQARLYDAEKPIVLPEMTQAIRYGFQIVPTDRVSEPVLREALVDDGTHGDKIAADGIFSFAVDLMEPGEYKLQIVAQAPTFERRQQLSFRVKPRMVTLSVSSGEAKEKSAESSADDSFLVELSPEVGSMKDPEIKIVAFDKNKKRFVLPMSQAGDALTFRARAALLPHDGEFQLQAFLSAENKKKGRIREESNTLEYSKVSAAGEEHEVHVVEVEKPPVVDSPSPLIPLMLVTLINAVAAGVAFLLVKRAQSDVSIKVPEFESMDDVAAAISQLEAAAVLTEIDLNDPRLADNAVSGLEFHSGSGAPPASSSAEAESTGELTEPPAEDASEEAAPANEAAPEEEAAEEAKE